MTTITTAVGGNAFFRRFKDTTGAEVTQATYSFCEPPLPAGVTQCAEGNGTVPDSSFIGDLVPDTVPNVLQLTLDTNMPGYINTLCTDPDFAGACNGGRVPAAGGMISLVANNTELGSTDINEDGSGTLYNARALFDGTVLSITVDQQDGLVETAILKGGIDVWVPPGTVIPSHWAMDHPQAAARIMALQKRLR